MMAAAAVALSAPLAAVQAAHIPQPVVFSGELDSHAFEVAALAHREVRIAYSPGGSGAAALALAQVEDVVIDGECRSACAWAFIASANVCFTSRASFAFHAAHDPGTGRRIPVATGYWLAQVRPSLQPRLEGLKSSSKLIEVGAKEMSKHYADRTCDADGHKRKAAPEILVASTLPPVILAAHDTGLGQGIERIDTVETSAVVVEDVTAERHSTYQIALDIEPHMPVVGQCEMNVPEQGAGLAPTLAMLVAEPLVDAVSAGVVASMDSELPNGDWSTGEHLISAIDRARWPFVDLARLDPGLAIFTRPRRRASGRIAAL